MTKNPYYKETTVHFRVDFEGLTQICRDFWAEGEYSKALAIMTESGISLKDAHDVIRGKLKMIQFPGGKEGVEGTLAKDNWEPNLGLCMWGKYPDPTDTSYFRMIERYGVKGLSEKRQILESTIYALQECVYSPDKERLIKDLKTQRIDDEIAKFFNLPTIKQLEIKYKPKMLSWDRDRYDSFADQLIDNNAVPMTWSSNLPPHISDVDAYIKRQLELDKITEKPKPCNPPQRTGWLSPKGEMFACNYNEHLWLADLLGYTGIQIEKEGWVKLHYTLLKPNKLLVDKGNPKKQLTQKQIDALWDWATHNKVDPEYIGEILEKEDEL